jgi:hypothetical protein
MGFSERQSLTRQILDLLLQFPPGRFIEPSELDAHTHSPMAGSDNCGGLDSFRVQPEHDVQDCTYRQGHHGLDLAAAAGYVGRVGLHMAAHALRAADFDRKANPLPREFSFVFWYWLDTGNGRGCGGALCLSLVLPMTQLSFHGFHSHFDLVRVPCIHRPHHFAARFLVAELHSDDVSGPELFLQPGKLGAVIAYILGVGSLREWTTVGIHAEHSDYEVCIETGSEVSAMQSISAFWLRKLPAR